VTAPALRLICDAVYLLGLTCWVGSILFFSFGVAPVIFRVLSAEAAATFVRALFPRYYLWGSISGAVALPAFLGVPLCFPEYRGAWIGLQALLILGATLVMLYCGNSLTPAINAARDAGPDQAERFERLHRRSVRLNTVVLLIGLMLLIAFAVRPTPRTQGMIELPPEAQAKRDAEVYRLAEQIAAQELKRRGIDWTPAR
jgi:uncharacterized membrane protein